MTSVSVLTKLAEKNEETWMLLGRLAEKMNDTERALHAFESVLRHQPYNLKALTQIASIYRSKDQYSKAVEYYHRALNVDNENCEIWGALGHCYLMMDDLQKAYAAYHQAIYHAKLQQRNKQDPHLWYGIGILYERYGSLDNAEEAFSSVIKMDLSFEKNNEIYFRLGIIYKQQMRYDQSLECFGNILNNPPSPLTQADIWFQIGHVYELKKDFEEAKKSYEHVLKYNPNHAKVLQQLGWLYHQNTQFGNQDVAISYLQRSIEADASDGQTWYLLGRCFMAQQKYRLAYDAYQQAVFRDGRNPTFWCSIGVLYYQINQYRDALDAYSRAIRLNPYLSEVWYDLGTLYESCNQITDALDAYQRAAELDPKNKHIQQRLNMLRNQSGKPHEKSQSTGQLAPINTVEPQNVGGGPRGGYPHDNAPPVPIQPKSGTSFPEMSRMHNGPQGPSNGSQGGPPNPYPSNPPSNGGSLPSMNSGPPPNPNVTLSSMNAHHGGHSNAPSHPSSSPYNNAPPSNYMNQYASNGPPMQHQRPSSSSQPSLPPPNRNAPSPFHGKQSQGSSGGTPGSGYGQQYPSHHHQPSPSLPPQHHQQQMPSHQQQQQQQQHMQHGGYNKGYPDQQQGLPSQQQHQQYNRTSPHPQLPPMSSHHSGPQSQQSPMGVPPMKDSQMQGGPSSGDHNAMKRPYEDPMHSKLPKPQHHGGAPSRRMVDEEEDEDEMVINDDEDDSQRRRRGTPNSFNRGPVPQDDNSFMHSNSRSRFVSKKKNLRSEHPSLGVNNNNKHDNPDMKKDE